MITFCSRSARGSKEFVAGGIHAGTRHEHAIPTQYGEGTRRRWRNTTVHLPDETRLSPHWLQGKLYYSRAVTGKNQGHGGAHAKYSRMHSGRRRRKDHDASLTASVPRAIPPGGVGEGSLDCSGVTFYRCRADEGQATSEPVHKLPHEGHLQRKIPQFSEAGRRDRSSKV